MRTSSLVRPGASLRSADARHSRRALAVVLAAMASGGLVAAEARRRPTSPRKESPLQAVVSDTRQRTGIPGLAIAVFRSRVVLGMAYSGVRRLGSPSRIARGDQFHIGSNVKAMTATMLATLVEDGILRWEGTLGEAFPSLADRIDPGLAMVTLEQLLAHRAGLAPWEELGELPRFTGAPTAQRRAAAEFLLTRPPTSPIGEARYSNAGYGLAAAVAEAATGRPWEALITARLLMPLGIHATFGWPSPSNQPWGHDREGDRYVPRDPRQLFRIPPVIAPAGDLSVSLPACVAFVQLHLRGLRGESRLLSVPSFRRLHASVEGSYALGWAPFDTDDAAGSAHIGGAGPFVAVAALLPSLDLGVAALANAGDQIAEDALVGLGIEALTSVVAR